MNLSKTKTMAVIFLMVTGLCIPLSVLAKSDLPPAPVNASDFLKGLDINGDMKFRYEYIDEDKSGVKSIDRMRGQFRLGMTWNNPDENWKVVAGLCTGGVAGNSSLATYSDSQVFQHNEIRMDYAYAENHLGDFKFLAGQQKNPFATSWVFWDVDLRPAGLTAAVDLNPVFITAGVYQARYVDRDIAGMEAVQIGAKTDFMMAAVAFYNYHRINEYVLTETMNQNYKYQIIDFYVSGKINTDPVALTPYAQAFYNAGAKGNNGQSILGAGLDPGDESMGYVVGVDAKIDSFKLGAAWAQIGADSVMQSIMDSNFGTGLNGTDTQGVKLNLGYDLTRHCSLDGIAYLYEAMERHLDQHVQMYELDLNYKF